MKTFVFAALAVVFAHSTGFARQANAVPDITGSWERARDASIPGSIATSLESAISERLSGQARSASRSDSERTADRRPC